MQDYFPLLYYLFLLQKHFRSNFGFQDNSPVFLGKSQLVQVKAIRVQGYNVLPVSMSISIIWDLYCKFYLGNNILHTFNSILAVILTV